MFAVSFEFWGHYQFIQIVLLKSWYKISRFFKIEPFLPGRDFDTVFNPWVDDDFESGKYGESDDYIFYWLIEVSSIGCVFIPSLPPSDSSFVCMHDRYLNMEWPFMHYTVGAISAVKLKLNLSSSQFAAPKCLPSFISKLEKKCSKFDQNTIQKWKSCNWDTFVFLYNGNVYNH